jgi:stage V sporulation protein B
MLANALFALVGYIIHFWLGRELGPAEYGTFGVVLYLMTTTNLLLTSGIPQSASKYIAEDNSKLGGIVRETNRIQLIFSIVVLGLYLGLSGVIAEALGDASLTPYIRLSALTIPTYAIYSVYNAGYLNGLRRFGRQAITTAGISVVKITLVFILVAAGLGIYGAITGYIASAVVGFFLAWRFLGPRVKNQVNYGWKKLAAFGLPATLFSAAFFLLMSIDLFVVKAIIGNESEVGYYTSAATVAKVPYYLFTGLAMALLPSISRAVATGDDGLMKNYINESVRYLLMILVPGVLLISATSQELLTLVYSSRYITAGESLSILSFGAGLLTIFYVLAHIVMGGGKPGIVLIIALIAVGISLALNFLLVPEHGLSGAAWATTLAGIFCTAVATAYILFSFKALIAPLSLLRILVSSVIVYLIGIYVSTPPACLPLLYAGLLALYGGLLIMTREITGKDLEMVKSMVLGDKYQSVDSPMP